MTGIGRNATTNICHEMAANTRPTRATLTAVRMISLAPTSRKRSSWLTSSFSTAIRPPLERSSKYDSSSRCTWPYASMRSSCSTVCDRRRHSKLDSHSVNDSSSQIRKLTAASNTSWRSRPSTPNHCPTSESLPDTTTSTAMPMRISGATSKILLSTVHSTARRTRPWWLPSYAHRRASGERASAVDTRGA